MTRIGVVGALVAVLGPVLLGACDAARDVDDEITETTTTTIAATEPFEPNAVVDFVIDGDTIDALIEGREERIRLIGIDTPETRPDQPIECYGPEATNFLEELLPVGTPIRIERDVVGRDDFGRVLGYVYRVSDGIFVNYEIVRQGFAQPLTIPPNVTHEDLFVDASRAAEADDTGLWSACAG